MLVHKTEVANLQPQLKGKKRFDIDGQTIIVDDRYSVNQLIGCGAYGVVYSAYDS